MITNQNLRINREENIIFIIDDDPFTLDLLRKSLSPFGRVYKYLNTNNFMEDYRKTVPDTVFLDIHLDGPSGIDVLKDIMKLDPKANIHMLSGDSSTDNIKNCIRLGARSFIGKPFTKKKLITALNKCPTLRNIPQQED